MVMEGNMGPKKGESWSPNVAPSPRPLSDLPRPGVTHPLLYWEHSSFPSRLIPSK